MATSKRNAVIGTVVDTLSTEVGWTEDFPIEGGLHIYNNQLKAHIGGEIVTVYPQSSSTTTTTTINISSAQILAMGTTPIELLPAPGANKYYDIEKVILEYTHVTTAYTLADPYIFAQLGGGEPSSQFQAYLITQSENNYVVDRDFGTKLNVLDEVRYSSAYYLNKDLTLTTWNGTDPTLGDGTLRAIITYTVRTFGA